MKNKNKDHRQNTCFFYKKHKVFLYKEDFNEFKSFLDETTNFIIDKKGEEVISEIHQKDFDSSKKLILFSKKIELITSTKFRD